MRTARHLRWLVGAVVMLGLAALAIYGDTEAVTAAARHGVKQSRSLSSAHKLKKALRACKKDKKRHKRKACQKRAMRLYNGHKTGRSATEKTGSRASAGTTGATTGTGSTTGAATGTGSTTGAGATTGPGTAGTGTTTGAGPTGTGTTTGPGTTTGAVKEWPLITAGTTALRVAYTNGFALAGISYSVECDPASGTIMNPVAVCAELAHYPGMAFEGAYGDHSCPPGLPSISVSGEYGGQPVKAEFSECGYGDKYQRNWEQFMPTEQQENEVGIDRAIGLFALGESQSSIEALLARAPAGAAGGLDVYHPWSFISGSCVRGLGIGGEESKQDLAMRYDSDGRLETVMGNTNGLTIEGHEVWSLLVRCPHSPEVEAVSHSEGPLTGWVSVTCGGHEAMADHPVSEDQTTQGSTLIIPAGEGDQWPLVIVTTNPTSACEDAARLNSEWRALLN